MSTITIEVDEGMNTAYVVLSKAPVARTVEHDDAVLIDLDEFGCAVGIEFLDQTTPIPFTDLVEQYHVHSAVVELLRLIRPDVASFIQVTRGNDGTTVGSSAAATSSAART